MSLVENIRFYLAESMLNRAYDCFYNDIEPKNIFSYLPSSVSRRTAFFLAEKAANSAQKGMRRSISSPATFIQWESLVTDAVKILLYEPPQIA